MPAYIYRCPCGNEEELDFRMGTAPSNWHCDECEGWMKRVFLPIAVSFKGSGFYRTDNPKTTHVNTRVKVGNSESS